MPLLRHLLRHPLIALCNVLGIALGVAVFLAMQSSNRRANRAFEASVDLVSGKAHAELRAEGTGFDEGVFPALRRLRGIRGATPMVEGFATLPDSPGGYVHVLGMDVFTAPPFQTASFKPEAWQGFDVESFLRQPGQWVVSERVAAEFGWKVGQTVAVEAGGRRQMATILHIVPNKAIEGSAAADSGNRLVLMDIGWAQEMFGQAGKLQSVQFLLEDPGQLEAFLLRARAEVALPPQAVLAAPQNRSAQIQTMVEGFQLNLTALSMVSMLVGVFLVYNTVSASTVRRRKEIGIMRALGATRGHVMRHFLAEATLYAVPGVALGLWAGNALAGMLAAGVSQTLSSRYLLVQLDHGAFDWPSAMLAAAYGLLATLLGALRPAWEAATLDPVVALHPGTSAEVHHRRRGRWLVAAMAFGLATPGFCYGALHGHPPLAFGACLTCVLAFACLSPVVSLLLAGAVQKFTGQWGQAFPLGTEAFVRSLHRTGLTIAALLSAVAMLVGVATMVDSFRRTVNDWISGSMDADLYIAPAANEVLGMRAFLPGEVVAKLQADPRLASPQGYREEAIVIPGIGPSTLTAVDASRAARFAILETSVADPLVAFGRGGFCFANESFARKHGIGVGKDIEIPTQGGTTRLAIAAVFRDYSDDRGRLFLNRGEFARLWRDERVHSMGFRLRDPVAAGDPGQVAAALRTELAGIGTFSVFTQSSLRRRVLDIFDQTFAITGILRTIAVAVAVLGVVLALLVLVMERTREISLLKALGASNRQVVAVFLVQAGWIGGIAALLGGLCGLCLALLLVRVVNPAFFGWTIPLHPVWGELALLPLWLAGTAVLAGLYPAWKATRLAIAPALRLE